MEDRKILIVGANGQQGTALRQKYPEAQFADVGEWDITNQQSVNAFDWSGIEIILNAAAYTNVDGAETPEGRVAAWGVNAVAVSNLASVCLQYGMTLVHISSDYVFDGTQNHTLKTRNSARLAYTAKQKQLAILSRDYFQSIIFYEQRG